MVLNLNVSEPDGVPIGEEMPEPEGTWAILFHDPDHTTEVFVGAGAEAAARTRYDQARMSWTCVLVSSVGVLPEKTVLTERVVMDVIDHAIVIISPSTGEPLVTIDAAGKVTVLGDADEAARAFWDKVTAYAFAIDQNWDPREQ